MRKSTIRILFLTYPVSSHEPESTADLPRREAFSICLARSFAAWLHQSLFSTFFSTVVSSANSEPFVALLQSWFFARLFPGAIEQLALPSMGFRFLQFLRFLFKNAHHISNTYTTILINTHHTHSLLTT